MFISPFLLILIGIICVNSRPDDSYEDSPYKQGANEIKKVDYHNEFEPRIIGGIKASCGKYPFSAFLFSETEHYLCSGAILSEYFFITAKHCVNEHEKEYLRVAAGQLEMFNRDRIVRRVNEIYFYPEDDYDHDVIHDIALIKVQHKYDFVYSQLAAIRLPLEMDAYQNRICEFVAWGLDAREQVPAPVPPGPAPGPPPLFPMVKQDLPLNQSTHLNWIKMRIEKKSEENVKENTFLAVVLKPAQQEICTGDSGGPLICNGKIVGINHGSMESACSNRIKFIEIYKYLNWIKEHLQK